MFLWISSNFCSKPVRRIDCLFKTISDGHRVAAAPLLFFVTSDKQQRRCFLAEKAAALQRCLLSKFSAAAATANKLLPRLFQFTFSHVTVWSLYSPLVITLLLLTSLFQFSRTYKTFVTFCRCSYTVCIGKFYRTWSHFF